MIRFSSDWHFLHRKVSEIRGFASVKEHDEYLVKSINSVMKDDDILMCCGDVAMGKDGDDGLEYVSRIRGRKQLITGNHDPVFPGHRDARKHQRAWLEVFESVQAYARVRLAGKDVLLSHFPYHGDHTEHERYLQYRLRDEGNWLIHGHTHSAVQYDSVVRPRMVHVGVDAWDMKPVSDQQVIKIIQVCEGSSQ